MKEELLINGYENEKIIANSLNGKRFCEVNPLFNDMLYKLYGKLKNSDLIEAKVNYNLKKYDLTIKINGVIKRISIKKGINNSVHGEPIQKFINFLESEHIEKEFINDFLDYFYADGTFDGTGTKRVSVKEYKEANQDKIDRLNLLFNQENIIKRCVNRFVTQGNNSKYVIDGLIYGTKNDFLFLSTDEIEKIILSKKNLYSTGIHFGQLFCQPMTRNLNNNPLYECKRHVVQIKWYTLFDDIIEYKNNYQETYKSEKNF